MNFSQGSNRGNTPPSVSAPNPYQSPYPITSVRPELCLMNHGQNGKQEENEDQKMEENEHLKVVGSEIARSRMESITVSALTSLTQSPN